MRSLLRRLQKLEASPAVRAAKFCPGCWGIRTIERYEDDPEPVFGPCPICNDTNPPRDGSIRFIEVIHPACCRPPRDGADPKGA